MKILIAVPTFEHIQNEVFQAIYDLDKCGHQCDLKMITGHDCARARNIIADWSVAGGYDYVLMIDSDTIVPKNALKNLLDPQADIVMGCCPKKNTKKKEYPLCRVQSPELKPCLTADDLQGTERIGIQVGGFACALVKTEVFTYMNYPYFKYMEYENRSILSEDYYFCLEAIGRGYEIWADPRVKCGHQIKGYQYE